MATVQAVPLTYLHPVQPVKVEQGPGVAVSVTCVPPSTPAEQEPGQLIPEGLVMTPEPEPVLVTVRVSVGGDGLVTVTVPLA